jgi:hypothetical protein
MDAESRIIGFMETESPIIDFMDAESWIIAFMAAESRAIDFMEAESRGVMAFIMESCAAADIELSRIPGIDFGVIEAESRAVMLIGMSLLTGTCRSGVVLFT